jgi:gamma-glutamylcysteine synthetase
LATNGTVRPINLDECEEKFLHSTDALSSYWYQVCVWSSVYVTALRNVICARHRNKYIYFKTAHKMVSECISVKETGNRD